MNSPLLKILEPQAITRTRRTAVDRETVAAAQRILDDIDARGEPAAIEYAARFGDWRTGDPVVAGPAELQAALARLEKSQRDLLERTASRIERFALAQRASLSDATVPIPGGFAGHECVPVESAACYAPGGRYPLPSSVLMTAVTARAAGVKSIVVISPRPGDAVLAAAAIAGAQSVVTIGGVQGIVVAARGLFGIPACDIIVGPGNKWVTAAKQLVSAETGIDMLAGPSELVVIADDSADPALVAADLLAQAEHDTDALPILIATRASIIDNVNAELRRQVATLPTRDTALAALARGFAVVARDSNEAVALSDRIVPEHLEIVTRDAPEIAKQVQSAGAIFIGASAAEVFGDYGAGPNHVLPTGGTARFRAGLSVFTFLRVRTWIRIDQPAESAALVRDAADLARIEQLEAHARSAERRSARR